MKPKFKFLTYSIVSLLSIAMLGAIAVGITALVLSRDLPSVEELREVQLQVPLKVFSWDGRLIAEFGDQRRSPVAYEDVPVNLVRAFLAAEDDRFFEHPGVDYQGILRAAWYLVTTGKRGQGGSTITMQLARNIFLTPERTFTRKAKEILLALKIERELGKQEILELYLNKIYLGNRAYGIGAAAQIYYNRPVNELTLAETAMIAGLPKAPSTNNPIADPTGAMQRRAYVLGRMLELGHIDEAQYNEAKAAPVTARPYTALTDIEAPYAAEMARQQLLEVVDDEEAVYTQGYRVYTTIDGDLQHAANRGLRDGLLAYDQRHGYRGPIGKVELPENLEDQTALNPILADYSAIGGLFPALVLASEAEQARIYLGESLGEQTISLEALAWARPFKTRDVVGDEPKAASDVLTAGDVIYTRWTEEQGWQLAQLPEVEGALVALSPRDGGILALTGGFDFFRSKFNRATQAKRQPGSNFKPFIYSSALENGFTAATVINDAPVVFEDNALEDTWRPENYSGKFYGPTRLRDALTYSRNLVSIRILREIGVVYAARYLTRFGFQESDIPRNLSLALGSGSVTPLELARAYAVFANGGHLVEPHLIVRIEKDQEVIFEAMPKLACDSNCPEGAEPAPQVITPQNAYLITSMLQDVIKRGTGRRALALGRDDLAGKTGTTNDQIDAWFSGFNGDIVATAWIGFDKIQPMGRGETGATAALPIWLDFMRIALDGKAEHTLDRPPGLVSVRIDPETGKLARATNSRAIFETFREGNVPEQETMVSDRIGGGANGSGESDPLF